MKVNQNTVLLGEKLVLVPYRTEHVPTYHGWMRDRELQILTASEPLSLEEEYQMQQQWLLDEDKLTFIILARTENLKEPNSSTALPTKFFAHEELSPTDTRVSSLPMVGDVNLFLKGSVPSSSNHLDFQRPRGGDDENRDTFEAEVEIMIAETVYRRRGFAFEALQLILRYATGAPSTYFGSPSSAASAVDATLVSPLNIPPTCLVTRISESNTASISLFEKLGFRLTKKVEVFREVEMRWSQPTAINMMSDYPTPSSGLRSRMEGASAACSR